MKRKHHKLQVTKTDREGSIIRMSVMQCAQRQREFSESAFGPGERQLGIIDHIRKELDELTESPFDLEEWMDIIILGLDGAWRAGFSSYDIADTLEKKMSKNEKRVWPDWKNVDRTKAIEHDRSRDEG